MKLTGFILAIYFLFLSLEPGLRDIQLLSLQKTESCCSESCEPIPVTTDPNNCSDTDACNPFETCKTCIGYSSGLANIDLTLQSLFIKSYSIKKEEVPPSITLDFWQPPKIA
jgi:hypothetical protein